MSAWDDLQSWLAMNVGSRQADEVLAIVARIAPDADPNVQYAFAVKDTDGNVCKFTVDLMGNGFVRTRVSDRTGIRDYLAQWLGDRWVKRD